LAHSYHMVFLARDYAGISSVSADSVPGLLAINEAKKGIVHFQVIADEMEKIGVVCGL